MSALQEKTNMATDDERFVFIKNNQVNPTGKCDDEECSVFELLAIRSKNYGYDAFLSQQFQMAIESYNEAVGHSKMSP